MWPDKPRRNAVIVRVISDTCASVKMLYATAMKKNSVPEDKVYL